MPKSVLQAIQSGDWTFEPETMPERDFRATDALPGSDEKLEILARRIQDGLPLWHPSDRHTYEDNLKHHEEGAGVLGLLTAND
ncbi:MAG: hypothetical protein P8N76_12155 [Pirellulaceae bacterium]|nr:hypothetical protein [Pirellulaceae bacterium]